MGFYTLELDSLSEYTNISVDDLMNKTYNELVEMIRKMNEEKANDETKRNAKDQEYRRIVLKFLEPLEFLKQWWSENEIIEACTQTHTSIRDLCGEELVQPGHKCHRTPNEFLRTSVELVPQYDCHGREYMERARTTRDVYRVVNNYQDNVTGKIIKYLLLKKHPTLTKYNFSCYGFRSYDRTYEIYPDKIHVYTPFEALMNKNIDAIIQRNADYCKSYNHGAYTVEEWEKRLASTEVQEYLSTIKNLD